jgi:hypothetical protein
MNRRSSIPLAIVAAGVVSGLAYLAGAFFWLWLLGTTILPDRLFSDASNHYLLKLMRLGVLALIALLAGLVLRRIHFPLRVWSSSLVVAMFGALWPILHFSLERDQPPYVLAWTDFPAIAWPEILALCVILPLVSTLPANHLLQRTPTGAAEQRR